MRKKKHDPVGSNLIAAPINQMGHWWVCSGELAALLLQILLFSLAFLCSFNFFHQRRSVKRTIPSTFEPSKQTFLMLTTIHINAYYRKLFWYDATQLIRIIQHSSEYYLCLGNSRSEISRISNELISFKYILLQKWQNFFQQIFLLSNQSLLSSSLWSH